MTKRKKKRKKEENGKEKKEKKQVGKNKEKEKKEREKKSLKKPLAYVFSCSLQNCSSDCVYWGEPNKTYKKGKQS
jgi:hypothetical protein